MGNTLRSLTLEKEVDAYIKEKISNEGFNCSEWFNETFKREFMGIEEKEKQIKDFEKRIEGLKKEIEDVKTRKTIYADNLTRDETRFLMSVPRRERDGTKLKSLWGGFKITFHKEWGLEKFKKIVKSVKEEK